MFFDLISTVSFQQYVFHAVLCFVRETEIRLGSVEEVLHERTAALATTQVQIKALQLDLRKKERMFDELQNHLKELEEEKKFQAEKCQADLEKSARVS